MTQPFARKNDPPTSKKAAKRQGGKVTARSIRFRVLQFLDYEEDGATALKIAVGVSRDPLHVDSHRRRVSELHADGLIEADGTARNFPGGPQAVVYKLNDRGRRVLRNLARGLVSDD